MFPPVSLTNPWRLAPGDHPRRSPWRWLPLLLLAVGVVHGQAPITEEVITDTYTEWVTAELKQGKQQVAKRRDLLVRRALIADRTARRIEILAVATGLAGNDPVEFFLVGSGGKDYEALAIAAVDPQDVHEALAFIGLPLGHAVDPEGYRFWPKGERVVMTFHWEEEVDGQAQARQARAEDLLYRNDLRQTLPRTGLCVTGRFVARDEEGTPTLKRSTFEDLASCINYRWNTFDVPYLANQGALYGKIVPNPELRLPLRQNVRIRLEPELPDGKTRVREPALGVDLAAGGEDLEDLRFSLTIGDQRVLQGATFEAFLAEVQRRYQSRQDLFVRLRPTARVPIAPLAEFCAMLDQVAERNILRPEPADNELYYQAFLPSPQWRDRQERLSQPVEVHLPAKPGDALRYTVIHEHFGETGVTLEPKHHQAAGLAALAAALPGPEALPTDTVFLYAPPGLPYGRVREAAAALAERLPVVYVWPEPGGRTEATKAPRQAPR